jgi:hypothetical protein
MYWDKDGGAWKLALFYLPSSPFGRKPQILDINCSVVPILDFRAMMETTTLSDKVRIGRAPARMQLSALKA